MAYHTDSSPDGPDSLDIFYFSLHKIWNDYKNDDDDDNDNKNGRETAALTKLNNKNEKK